MSFIFNKKVFFIFIVSLGLLILAGSNDANASGSGTSRGTFTRSGWVGARYAGMGMAAEVISDDVFAIFWNPAGISELRSEKHLSVEEIKEKAR